VSAIGARGLGWLLMAARARRFEGGDAALERRSAQGALQAYALALGCVLLAGCGERSPTQGDAGTRAATRFANTTAAPGDSAVPGGANGTVALLELVSPESPAARLLGLPPPAIDTPVRSLRATSRVTYVAAPDRPHQLIATFVFPDRARLELRLPGDDLGERLVESRLGDHFGRFEMASGEWHSLEGEERADALRRTELRRAAIAFPDGMAWGAATTRSDDHVGVEYRAPLADGGALVAWLDGFAALERVTALDAAGHNRESIRVRTTSTIGNRVWPRDLDLEVGGVRLWQETVLGVQPGVNFFDSFFAPTADGGLRDPRELAVRLIDLPAVWERRFELAPTERGWAAARARAQVWLAELEEAADLGGPAVDPRPSFEVDADGRPRAVLVRAKASDATPKPGFDAVPARRAATLIVPSLESVTPGDLRALRAEVARSAELGADSGSATTIAAPVAAAIYAREAGLGTGTASTDGPVQLVLPLPVPQ